MSSGEDLAQAVHRIYDAAFDPKRYATAAADVNRLIGTDGVTFVLHTTNTQQVHFAGMVQYDHLPVDEVLAEYGSQWHARNPQVLFERRHPQAPLYYEGIDRHLNGAAYPDFRRWVRARVGARSQMTSYCRPHDDLTFAFAFSSHDHDGPESGAQIECLRHLTAHLQRSVQLAFRLGSLQARCEQWEAHLMRHELAIAVLESDGRLALCNPAMERYMRTCKGLSMGAQGLAASDPQVQRRLRALIAAALDPQRVGEPSAMVLHGTAGELQGLLEVTAMAPPPQVLAPGPARVIVTITQPAAQSTAARRKFEALFGLTPAEAQVAVLLMQGLSAAEAARQLALQVSTVRTHVRAILLKTHTRSKAELAHCLTLCG